MKTKNIVVYKPDFTGGDSNVTFEAVGKGGRTLKNDFGENFNIAMGEYQGENISMLPFKIETAELSDDEAMELKRDPKIADVFQSMPLSLIEPMNEQANVDINEANSKNTWGIEAVGADKSTFTGKGVKIAVLDTGINDHHIAFSEDIRIVSRNFTSETQEDIIGHGTHCAGTIFGRDVNGMRIGIARGVTEVFNGKVIGRDSGDVCSLLDAIDAAVKFGAHVISMSLGIDFPGMVERLKILKPEWNPKQITSMTLNLYMKNINLLERHVAGIRANWNTQPFVLIAAAGNESSKPNYSITVSPPAVSEGFISVGALAQSNGQYTVANFSNSEPKLSGPGVAVISAGRNNGLKSMDGTSMAAPHAAGIAALWAQRLINQKQFNNDMFYSTLIAACCRDRLQSESPIDYGAGIVQAP